MSQLDGTARPGRIEAVPAAPDPRITGSPVTTAEQRAAALGAQEWAVILETAAVGRRVVGRQAFTRAARTLEAACGSRLHGGSAAVHYEAQQDLTGD